MRRARSWWVVVAAVAVPCRAWAQPGPPHSIELVVVSDVAQDIIHVQRPPLAQVQVKAVVRDLQGNVLAQPVAGCTPIFQRGSGLESPPLAVLTELAEAFVPVAGLPTRMGHRDHDHAIV